MDDCCVCLDAVAPPRTRRLPCGHTLHKRCAVRWLARSRSCPLCRTAVPRKASQVLQAAARAVPRRSLCVGLPGFVKRHLGGHPHAQRAVELAFLTADVDRLIAALRGLGL